MFSQVTAPKSGAEVIPFIKTYVNLPVAIVSAWHVRTRTIIRELRSLGAYSASHSNTAGLHWFICQDD